MNVSRITVTRESLKKSKDACYYDGYRKYKEVQTIEHLDRVIAALLYQIVCNESQKMEVKKDEQA